MKKLISVLVLLFWSSVGLASTADDISKDVNSLIRSSEKAFFKGEINEAASILQQAEERLGQLKSEDSGHKSLKSLQKKHDRLKARVDKKLGANATTATTAKTTAPGAEKSAPAASKLSHGAKSNLKKAGKAMDFAEQEFAKGEKSLQQQDFNLVESYVANAKGRLDEAEGRLNMVVTNNKADPNHPDVASAFQRHKALLEKHAAFSSRAHGEKEEVKLAGAKAKEDAAKLNEEWLPKVKPYIAPPPSDTRVQYLGSHNPQVMAKQDELYDQAKKVLVDVEKEVPEADRHHELRDAVKSLRLALEVYEKEKGADNRNRLQPIESTISGWEKRFEQNKKWSEDSDQGLFVITKGKLEHQKKQIAELQKVSPEPATGFGQRLAALEEENAVWVEKKRSWQERPRPFPEAKMVSKQLLGEMEALLEDRGIEVEDIAIVDKEWWVQSGEFRYVSTAVLSEDDDGEYWSNVSFRQMKTLAGYGPTEIWDIDKIRIRLP
jgi:hypothetical protein